MKKWIAILGLSALSIHATFANPTALEKILKKNFQTAKLKF